jgi:ABC-type bacteriocin/lantibiotic exporter with double-glycine peptidase domain
MQPFQQIFQLIKPYWKQILQSTLAGILIMLLSIPGPMLTKVLIDEVYPHRDTDLLTFVLIIGAAISIVLGTSNLLSGYYSQCVGIRMGLDYQSRFYRHIQSLDFSFFDRRETGEILARFGDMRSSISNVIGILNSFIMNSLQLIIFPPILIFLNWKLALISLAVLPFDTLIAALSRPVLRSLSQRLAEKSAELSARTIESISGIRTVQALGMESAFHDNLKGIFLGVSSLQLKSSLFQGSLGLLSTLLKTAGTLGYSWYGWSLVLSGELSLGSFLAFSAYVGYLFGPIEGLVSLIPRIEVCLVHANRFFEVYQLKPTVLTTSNLPAMGRVHGNIVFQNVSFSYDSKTQVLSDIDLLIPHGQPTALVGSSGSGKSTLAKLIPRFYDPCQGAISIDGQDLRSVSATSLRKQIGFALQGSNLFQGTIQHNLTFGRDLPPNEIEDACRSAHIHDFIASLPDAYQTRLGEQGAQLSEGQKQRVALARVLLLDTPILILDEPTSALDPESEYFIQRALETISEGRTTLIIAHRLTTIQRADQIVVMNQGRIVERGPHDELMMLDGEYANLSRKMASV